MREELNPKVKSVFFSFFLVRLCKMKLVIIRNGFVFKDLLDEGIIESKKSKRLKS